MALEQVNEGGRGVNALKCRRLERYLLDRNIKFRVIGHLPVNRASQRSVALEVETRLVIKAVVCRAGKNDYIVCVIPASRRVDLTSVQRRLGKPLSLADEAEVRSLFPNGEIGALPPLVGMLGVDGVLDPEVLDSPTVYLPAGMRDQSIAVESRVLLSPRIQIATIAADDEGNIFRAPGVIKESRSKEYHVWLTWWIAVLLTALILAAVVGSVLLFPRLIVENTLSSDQLARLAPAERLTGENNVRTSLLQSIAGALFVVTAYFAWRQLQVSRRQTAIAQDKQVTDVYGKAIEQLASSIRTERLGGVYVLLRIARDSPSDREAISAILGAFVRDCDEPRSDETQIVLEQLGNSHSVVHPSDGLSLRGVRAANLRLRALDFSRFDFSESCLAGVDFSNCLFRDTCFRGLKAEHLKLAGADLSGADIRDSVLESTCSLNNAILDGADLRGAVLVGVTLRGASLRSSLLGSRHYDCGADLSGANLAGADFAQAPHRTMASTLASVNLSHAILSDANLAGADLSRATLRGARLDRANLCGANLAGALLEEAVLVDVSWDSTTTWPIGFSPPG